MDEEGLTTTVGTWASLQLDLLLEVFRRLESTAVIRCAGTCKPWRRAIVGNARFLRPRPDRFAPNLLLGVFHVYGENNHQHAYLQRTPGPFQSALPSTGGAAGSESRIQTLIPATGGFDRETYSDLLSSRDGLILLRARRRWSGVCLLCNPMTGDCKILPDAATIRSCKYILLTNYDDLSLSGMGAVRILAVAGTDHNSMCTKENRITYQVFSFTSGGSDGGTGGAWGPVKRSVELKKAFRVPLYHDGPGGVVSGEAVYWLAGPPGHGNRMTFVVALDVRTGRAWTIELPKEIQIAGANILAPTLLATTGDGRLSLIRSLRQVTTGGGHRIQVWVLTGDDDDHQWSLQKTIEVQVQKLLPDYRHDSVGRKYVVLDAFCPRSGWVIGSFAGQEIRIHLEGSSHTCVELIRTREGFYWNDNMWVLTAGWEEFLYCNNTYEMDWSTYISKMKQF